MYLRQAETRQHRAGRDLKLAASRGRRDDTRDPADDTRVWMDDTRTTGLRPQDAVKASFPTLKVGKEAFTERDQAPAADFRSAARAVLSHGSDSSGRPKWPYAAVGA